MKKVFSYLFVVAMFCVAAGDIFALAGKKKVVFYWKCPDDTRIFMSEQNAQDVCGAKAYRLKRNNGGGVFDKNTDYAQK